MFNVITGYERVDRGNIRFMGKDITRATPEKVFHLGIGRTFQLTRIFARLTVQVLETVLEMQRLSKTILLVEQNVRKGLSLSTYGVVMESGRVRLEGTHEEILNNPEIGYLYLGARCLERDGPMQGRTRWSA